MKKMFLSLGLGLSIIGVGCGGGGGGSSGLTIEQQLQNCLGTGATYVLALTAAAQILQGAIEDGVSDPAPGVTVSPSGTENQWNFTYPIDADGMDGPGSGFSGTFTFSADPTDGVEAGDTAMIVWNLAGSEGLSGSGTFNVTFQESAGALVWGAGSIDMVDDCEFSYDIDENDPMTIDGAINSQPVAEFFGAEFFGVMEIVAMVGEHTLAATIAFAENNNTVNATNVAIDGVDAADFEADLPFQPDLLEGLAFCLLAHAEGSFSLIEDILEAVEEESLEGAAVTITPTGPFTANFVITYGGEFIDRVTGSVALSGDPSTSQTLTVTLRFNAEFANDIGTMRTPAAKPIVLFFGDWGPENQIDIDDAVINGRVRCDLAGGGPILVQQSDLESCVATVDFLDFQDEGGAAILKASGNGVTLRVDLFDDEGPAFLSLNGVPLPPQLLDAILGLDEN